MRRLFLLPLLLSTLEIYGAEPEEGQNLLPGLLAEYRTLTQTPGVLPLRRIDPKPSFTWGDSTPHPRLPSGPFEVTWSGRIELEGDDDLRFGAFSNGKVRVQVDGEEVLQASNREPEAWHNSNRSFSRGAGTYPIRIVFSSIEGTPARLQLWWSGKSFSSEPIPAYRFTHPAAEFSEAWRRDDAGERGRVLVAQLGCAQCHREAFPGIKDGSPGPLLKDLGDRVSKELLQSWLENPRKFVPHARMPALFSSDRGGFVERSLIADYLIETFRSSEKVQNRQGDHRAGRQSFVGLGCATCHSLPDGEDAAANVNASTEAKAGVHDIYQDRLPLKALGDRFNLDQLATFLQDPNKRYPDARMPRLPMSDDVARNIAAYLLLWSQPSELKAHIEQPRGEEIQKLADRLGTKTDHRAIGVALIKEKRCAACHADLGTEKVENVPLPTPSAGFGTRGCLSEKGSLHFPLNALFREAITAYAEMAASERFDSPFEDGRRQLHQAQCFRCHQGDSVSPAPMEAIGKTLWTPHLMRVPYQRTPRLTQALSKYNREHLISSIRDGVSGIRPSWYSYRMPLYGDHAERLVEALAANDGEPVKAAAPVKTEFADPTLQTLGATLVGFEGYSCVACHIWKGRELTSVDPGSVGPELTSVTARINRDWFTRWLENPTRQHPGTPMPAFFQKDKPALIASVLDGKVSQQIEALWAYFSQGTNATDLTPKRSIPIVLPSPNEPPLVAQIPVALGRGETLESICLQFGAHDLVLYDVAKGTLHSYRAGSQILRNPNGWRTFVLSETDEEWLLSTNRAVQLLGKDGQPVQSTREFAGYELLPDGVLIRSRIKTLSAQFELNEEIRIPQEEPRRLLWRWRASSVPDGFVLEFNSRIPQALASKEKTGEPRLHHESKAGRVEISQEGDHFTARCLPVPSTGKFDALLSYPLPPARKAKIPPSSVVDVSSNSRPDESDELLRRPGYRAIRYPMPKTADYEDRVMPSALAVDPKTGRLFVASLKLGELFVLNDPTDNGVGASYRDYSRGLFQDAYSMLHDGQALYLLHRRNLTRISDLNNDGFADSFERVAPLRQNPGNTYDWAYGLVRDAAGRFIISFAPYADNKNLPGMGGILRLKADVNGIESTELGSGLRNAFGWTTGPDGEVFFTDNQGDWVPANKLCHLIEGKNYGYPNAARPDLVTQSADSATVWVPYDWAKSINGVTYDNTGGKFGPFSGQFFMAELMHGGAIVRANVEKVNGIYQGAAFPFWGKGLLGPLVLTFDLKGRLWVGSITQPGWMAQPDRGGLFRIDYTGEAPFEFQSIHVRPKGFRLVLTKPVSAGSATSLGSYAIEHFRYEFSGAYGSPELDKTPVIIESVALGSDNKTVELITSPLTTNRVYSITAGGIRSASAEPLLHPTAVYTLKTVPMQ